MQNTPRTDDPQDQTVFIPPMNVASDPQLPPQNAGNPEPSGTNQSFFYTQDQEDDGDLALPAIDEQDDQGNQSAPFVLPFQNSAALPKVAQANPDGTTGTPPSALSGRKSRRSSLQLVKILLITSVVLMTIIGAGFFVMAQSAPSPEKTQGNGTLTTTTTKTRPAPTTQPAPKTAAKTTRPRARTAPAAMPPPSLNQGQGTQNQEPGAQGPGPSSSGDIPSASLLNQLGWTQAGLSLSDAIEALRTGMTFTEREMSYDYRNIGPIALHGGTLTAATFLLTPGGLIRFAHNDIRVINNVLYDTICHGKIIQQVENAHPTLVQFQTLQIQGQTHTFAWMNVVFERFQSKIDPASGTRVEHLELNPATGQPMLHTMTVVIMRVPLQSQGVHAPMGGTGWLVNTYALDAQTLPPIETSPFL
jgi:hypothetical protein